MGEAGQARGSYAAAGVDIDAGNSGKESHGRPFAAASGAVDIKRPAVFLLQ